MAFCIADVSRVLSKTQEQPAYDLVINSCEDLYLTGERNPFLLAYIVDSCLENLEKKTGVPSLSGERAIAVTDYLKIAQVSCFGLAV